MLKGQAKTDYQREYMRKRRSNQRSNVTPETVRPSVTLAVRPVILKAEQHIGASQAEIVMGVHGELTKARQVSAKGFNG